VVHDIWVPCPFGLVRALTGIFLPGFETFYSRRNSHPFFKLYQGWNEAKMIMQAKMFSAMGVWTSLDHNSRPHHQPLPTRKEGSPEFAALYRFDFLEDGLRSIHREGPGRAMPH
jgi:hypothetical protein